MITGNLDAALSMLEGLPEDAENDVCQTHFPLDIQAFVSKFAKINVYRNEVVGNNKPLGTVSGGSRDPPSRWLYPCINAPACRKTFVSRYLQQSHAANCDLGSKIIHPFACSSCDSTFPTPERSEHPFGQRPQNLDRKDMWGGRMYFGRIIQYQRRVYVP